MFGTCMEKVRENGPLVHNITNYVTVNDVANMELACGGSPIMADEPEEVKDIQKICSALNLNIGTLNERTVKSMFKAGKKAKKMGHPILLDPVGAGASALRTETALRLLDELKPDVVRGNISEIKTLAAGSGNTHGVDAAAGDAVTDDNLEEMAAFARRFAAETGAICAITGAIDLVADAETCYVIRNGVADMSRITGTGCQLSGLMTCYIAANPDHKLEAAAAAVAEMGLAGEIAKNHLRPGEGNASLRNRIIDAVDQMEPETLNRYARYEKITGKGPII